jgi:hypothetical protein
MSFSNAEAAAQAQADPYGINPFGNADRIVKDPNTALLLRHHPYDWEVCDLGLDGPTLLPVITPHPLEPGAEGIRTLNKGEDPSMAYRDAVNRAKIKGWVYIDHTATFSADLMPDGVAAGRFWRVLPCINRTKSATGSYFFEAWAVPVDGLPGEEQRFNFDKAAHNRWRAHLVESGAIKAPLPLVVERLVNRYGERVNRWSGKQNLLSEIRDAQVADAVAIAEAVESAVVPGVPKSTAATKSTGKRAPSKASKAAAEAPQGAA